MIGIVISEHHEGAQVAWTARPRVRTRARRAACAPVGFADSSIQAVARYLQGLVPAAI
jgi:hypothetical protein